MGSSCKTRQKGTVGFPHSTMEEDIDLDEQLVKGSCYGDDECTWLSSAVSSPASVFEDYRFFTSLHVSVDEKSLISWLSRLESYFLYLDEANVNPMGKASSFADLPWPILDAEEKQLTSLCKNAASCPSMDNSGKFCEDLISCNNSSIPCSSISDSDKISFLVSLVNLDVEDSQLISSDTELELDYFQSDFPSPSCKSCEVMKDEHPQNGAILENTASDQEVDLEDSDTDEPIFWPSQWKLDWNCEKTWKCFSMSPRKCITKPGTHQDTSSKLSGTQFHVIRMDTNEGCKERPEFRSGSTASSLRRKNNCIKKMNATPSRLRKSKNISVKIVHIELENDRDFSEDDIRNNGEVPIEKLLGLGEFDGHEGVESEFNGDIFSLDESL